MGRRLCALVLVLFLMGCGTPGPIATPAPTVTPTPGCDPARTTTFLDDLEALLEEWDDTNALARSTARISLSPVIRDLQDIKRRVGEFDGLCRFWADGGLSTVSLGGRSLHPTSAQCRARAAHLALYWAT
jgi:hypothetical protein